MAGADVVDILGERVVERGRVEAARSLHEMRFLLRIGDHAGQPGKDFLHAAHFAGDVHVPHLVAVAGPGLALRLVPVHLHVRAVMQPVPDPKAHVFRNQEGLGGDLLVVDVRGDVHEAGQLLVDGIIGSPNPLLIVVGGIFFNEDRMLGRDGVKIAVPIAPAVLLVLVERRPSAFQLGELGLRDEVPRLAVPAQLLVPDERQLLAGAELVHHPADAAADLILEGRIVRARESECEGGHVVSRSVALKLRGRGIPAVGYGVAVRGQAIRVAVVIQLLGDVQREQILHVQVAVRGEPVVADEPDAPERQRPGDRLLRRHGGFPRHHRHLRLHRKSVLRRIVSKDISRDGISRSHRQGCLLFLGFPERVRPLHLAPFAGTVRIGDPDLVRQHGRRALRGFDPDFRDGADGFPGAAGGQQDEGNRQQEDNAERMTESHGKWF